MNIRECKLAPRASGGNLLKGPVSDRFTMDMPTWVAEALKANPREPLWQVYCREDEIKITNI
jgi:hypothetical protein